LPPQSILAGILINELDQIKQAFILILDDYHVIHNKAIHDLFIEILKHPLLLQRLLKRNFSQDYINDIHKQASLWFSGNGLP